jgi:hypothetical protein
VIDGAATRRSPRCFATRAPDAASSRWDRRRRVERESSNRAEQIRRWRLKAEELPTAADGFADGAARQHLRNSAETYEALAINAAARLDRRKLPKREAG